VAYRVRDIALIDAIEAKPRAPFDGDVWRVTREGRDPVLGGPSNSRWCNGAFDVHYTSQEKDGAIAEIHAFLSEQPVFPSKLRFHAHCLKVQASRTLRIADLQALEALGVDVSRYSSRDYARTQAIADAACFLDFDGLIAPSARWNCQNIMLFTQRLGTDQIVLVGSETSPVDFGSWRRDRAFLEARQEARTSK
jgi:RES domain-containing protein